MLWRKNGTDWFYPCFPRCSPPSGSGYGLQADGFSDSSTFGNFHPTQIHLSILPQPCLPSSSLLVPSHLQFASMIKRLGTESLPNRPIPQYRPFQQSSLDCIYVHIVLAQSGASALNRRGAGRQGAEKPNFLRWHCPIAVVS